MVLLGKRKDGFTIFDTIMKTKVNISYESILSSDITVEYFKTDDIDIESVMSVNPTCDIHIVIDKEEDSKIYNLMDKIYTKFGLEYKKSFYNVSGNMYYVGNGMQVLDNDETYGNIRWKYTKDIAELNGDISLVRLKDKYALVLTKHCKDTLKAVIKKEDTEQEKTIRLFRKLFSAMETMATNTYEECEEIYNSIVHPSIGQYTK